MAGVPLKTIQVLAGHKTISITARSAHLAPNTLHNAVELIAAASLQQAKSSERSATGTATAPKQGNRNDRARKPTMSA